MFILLPVSIINPISIVLNALGRFLLFAISYAAIASSVSANTFLSVKKEGTDLLSAFIVLNLFKVVRFNYYLLTLSFDHAVKTKSPPYF